MSEAYIIWMYIFVGIIFSFCIGYCIMDTCESCVQKKDPQDAEAPIDVETIAVDMKDGTPNIDLETKGGE